MLFKNTIILKQFAQLTGDVNFDNISSTIQRSEQEYILPILGKDLYAAMLAEYAVATSEELFTGPLKLLQTKCRMVVGPIVCALYAPKSDVQLSDGGMRRAENNAIKTAYQEQRFAFIEANQLEGESAQENLIQFLEENKAKYPEWITSPEFKKYRSLFIKTGAEFNEYFTSHTPFRNYVAIRPKMIAVEQLIIQSFLGKELFTFFKEQDIANDPTTLTKEEMQLIYYLKNAIANFSIGQALPMLSYRIDSNGLTVMNTSRSTSDQISPRGTADKLAFDYLAKTCISAGQEWLNHAKDHIKLYEDSFPTWIGFVAASSKFESLNNTKTKNIFGL